MSLSELIHKNSVKPIATATVATLATHGEENRPTVANVASVAVANIGKSKIEILNQGDRQTLLNYLAAIGETGELMIQDFLTGCAQDSDKLAWALAWANKTLKIQNNDFAGRAQCASCVHLSGDTCLLHGWRVVVNRWRECRSHVDATAQDRATHV